jgi:ureidoacrylate peracid hydrolase
MAGRRKYGDGAKGMAHRTEIRQEIVERVLARRGRLHLFDAFAPAETALIAIDMQNTFVAEGAPAEVPTARAIVPALNRLTAALRARGVAIIWVTHVNRRGEGGSDWPSFFDHFVAADMRERTIASLAPDGDGQRLWPALEVAPGDLQLRKNRYSALIPGASDLDRALRQRRIRTLLIAGTKTNVCCEATGRDAMMMGYNVVMVSDCLAALSDDEHRASLETIIQQFGDVLSGSEVVSRLGAARP